MNDRVQNVKLQSIMEWQIPEPLSIRPCQKPSDFKARQLNSYPVKLRKLPQWVDQARFQPTFIKKDEQNQPHINNLQSFIQNDQHFTLPTKYKNKHKYALRYERGQEKYHFNQNFAHQYIPTNYTVLEDHLKKQRIQKQEKICEKIEDEGINIQSEKKSYQIQFDSKFQCGNLSKVYQVKNSNEYHLIMQKDINTLGYNQWYAFSMQNNQEHSVKVQIKIVNFVKQRSLYKKGMKPWIINQETKCWRQLEGNCCYKKTNVRSQSGDNFYQLEFNVNLPLGLTYMAMLPIYSYSRLSHNIERWKNIKGMNIYSKKVYSLVNNIVPILQYVPEMGKPLTNQKKDKQQNSQSEENSSDEEHKKSMQTIVVFARIHPGQVWSSYLMQQVIDSVIDHHKKSQLNQSNRLRYLFLPMLNPDGVIYGNFRCDFSGVDLNRVWIEPSKFTQCSIYQIKKILNKQFLSNKAAYFIDLHSHSKAYNVFAYTSAENIQQSRLLSDFIRLSSDNFIFDHYHSTIKLGNQFIKQGQTTFLSSKDIFLSKKKSTARAFMSRLTQKGRSMTVQISFYGYQSKQDDQNPIRPFLLADFRTLSECLIRNLNDFFFSSDEQFLKTKRSLMVLYTNYLAQLTRQHNQNLNALKKQNKAFQQEKDVSQDSDSQPQKYYTTETKKLIKSKNGELYDCRIITHRQDKKSYMKQTESMIHKTDVTKKDKNNNNPVERSKIHSGKINLQNPSKKDDVGKKISISEYPIRAESQRKKKPSVSQKQTQTHQDMDVNLNGNDKHNIFRKKVFVQSRNKDKKQPTQNKSQVIDSKKDIINNSVFEPAILDLDESKKHQPVFGQFLTKSKRSASRRYKTVTKQEFTIYQAEMARMRKNDLKQNFMKKDKTSNALCTFLEDNMYIADLSFPRTEHHKKNVSMMEPLVTDNRQSRNSSRKANQFYQSKLKRNGLERANNFKNIYMFQRKKIIEMMNKQTRFYNVIQKQSNHFGQVQEIVDKRKRAKTEFDSFKTCYDEKNIFFNTKMAKMQKQ